uniref:NAD(P)-binding domain-containing protein n=1 Tax=Bionectria ochroleuca TaxID=29856 RepID=A0A8H7NJK5_BIOOC
MKLIIAGSSGFALSIPSITEITALGRRETLPPNKLGPNSDVTKLRSVVLGDFLYYTDEVRKSLEGADAVIWIIAISPSKLSTFTWEEACIISRDYAVKGIETTTQLPRHGKTQPLRFIYMNGSNAVRDHTKKPLLMGNYLLMRGDVETKILNYATASNGTVEAQVTKTGIIEDPAQLSAVSKLGRAFLRSLVGLPMINVDVIAAALLDQAINGFEKDTLLNEDLVRIGETRLAAGVYGQKPAHSTDQ